LASLFPQLLTEEDLLLLESLCTREEIWDVLKAFAKDRSPGPDGWMIEFPLL